MEAEFETRVPWPVITVEPKNIDVDFYRQNNVNQIMLNITNHGLVRADNFSLTIPDSQVLRVTSTIPLSSIGQIDALTSVLVPLNLEFPEIDFNSLSEPVEQVPRQPQYLGKASEHRRMELSSNNRVPRCSNGISEYTVRCGTDRLFQAYLFISSVRCRISNFRNPRQCRPVSEPPTPNLRCGEKYHVEDVMVSLSTWYWKRPDFM